MKQKILDEIWQYKGELFVYIQTPTGLSIKAFDSFSSTPWFGILRSDHVYHKSFLSKPIVI